MSDTASTPSPKACSPPPRTKLSTAITALTPRPTCQEATTPQSKSPADRHRRDSPPNGPPSAGGAAALVVRHRQAAARDEQERVLNDELGRSRRPVTFRVVLADDNRDIRTVWRGFL